MWIVTELVLPNTPAVKGWIREERVKGRCWWFGNELDVNGVERYLELRTQAARAEGREWSRLGTRRREPSAKNHTPY